MTGTAIPFLGRPGVPTCHIAGAVPGRTLCDLGKLGGLEPVPGSWRTCCPRCQASWLAAAAPPPIAPAAPELDDTLD